MPFFVNQRELDLLHSQIAEYKEQRDKAVERLEHVERTSAYYVRHFMNQFLKARKATPLENIAPEELKPPPKIEPPPALVPADQGEWLAVVADYMEGNPEWSLNQAESAARELLQKEGKLAPV